MRTTKRLFTGVAVATWMALLMLLNPSVAHAATDVVRSLDVVYDVQADGSIQVEYTIDWDFGETGRRGIVFGIPVREPWDLDDSKDARYVVSDIEVSSPTGAPDRFSVEEVGSGSRQDLELRIGDPNRTLDTTRETYVIAFDLTGGLRTFDGVPELHLDVTSPAYPTVERFTVTVKGPDGVDRARCLVGDDECVQSVASGVATLSGGPVVSGDRGGQAAGLRGRAGHLPPLPAVGRAVRAHRPLEAGVQGTRRRRPDSAVGDRLRGRDPYRRLHLRRLPPRTQGHDGLGGGAPLLLVVGEFLQRRLRQPVRLLLQQQRRLRRRRLERKELVTHPWDSA